MCEKTGRFVIGRHGIHLQPFISPGHDGEETLFPGSKVMCGQHNRTLVFFREAHSRFDALNDKCMGCRHVDQCCDAENKAKG